MAETTPAAGGKARAVVTIILVSILIVLLSALAGWYLFLRGGNDADECEAYGQAVSGVNHSPFS